MGRIRLLAVMSHIVIATLATAAADAAETRKSAADLFARKCVACHEMGVITSVRKGRADWQATVARMVSLGAPVTPDEAKAIVGHLVQRYGAATPKTAHKELSGEGKLPEGLVLVPGLPLEKRSPELSGERPAFNGQTRAPYRPTTSLHVATIASGLNNPWSLAFLPDGSFLVTEKPGTMRIITSDGILQPPLSGVPAVFYKTQVGLLDVVLDRDFAENQRIFFSYMVLVTQDTAAMRIASAVLDRHANSLMNVKVIFDARPDVTVAQPGNSGGRLAVASDGTLYATIGDRVPGLSAGWNKAQELDKHIGKIVRINPDGSAPADNPFVGKPDARPEIWSYGHRSPQGLAFSPSGQLWETEHGPRGGDELNLIRRGANYGWPLIAYGIEYRGALINAGKTAEEGLEQPQYYWDPVIAPSGFAFYTGSLFPQWQGSVLIGALRGERLTRLTLSSDNQVIEEEPLLVDLHKRIRDVRVAPDGAVYVLTDESNGMLLKLTPAA